MAFKSFRSKWALVRLSLDQQQQKMEEGIFRAFIVPATLPIFLCHGAALSFLSCNKRDGGGTPLLRKWEGSRKFG